MNPIPGHRFSKAFLDEIGAPANCLSLTFKVHANGFLKCSAEVYTGEQSKDSFPTESKKWEVRLADDSAFRKLLTGEPS